MTGAEGAHAAHLHGWDDQWGWAPKAPAQTHKNAFKYVRVTGEDSLMIFLVHLQKK